MTTDTWADWADPGPAADDPAEAALAGAPAIDGPFVEVGPGVWVRATDVSAVARAPAVEPGDRTRSRVYVPAAGRTRRPAVAFASPYRVDALVTALRLAEHHEDVRRLELALERVARLMSGPTRRP
jgi:hypothetical protein